jgi:hypothetical protein
MLALFSYRFVFVSLVLSASALPASADTPPQLCEALAAQAGAAAGLPEGLLPAIARVESGTGTDQGRRAWPWTLNQAGDGSYHPTKAEALAHLDGILANGIRNVDLGCMQLNWRWHGDAFPDAATMMDPRHNTRYAAAFLKDLHSRHGSWTLAVAHYHSANPQRGAAYAAKVAKVRADLVPAQLDIHQDFQQDIQTATCTQRASPYGVTGPTTACQQTRGLLLTAAGGLLGAGSGQDLRQSPDSAAAPPPRYLR